VSSESFAVTATVVYSVGEGEGRQLWPIPLASFFDLRWDGSDSSDGGPVISKYECYMDLSPLFTAIGLDITSGEDGQHNVAMAPRK
jgi:hypothetical protein